MSVFIAGLVLAGIWVSGLAGDCANRWKASGFAYEFRDGSCMVLAGSKWLPEFAITYHLTQLPDPSP